MSEKIETIQDLGNYISKYRDTIYVREKMDGKWGSYSLGELPMELAMKHATRFLREKRIPTRLRTEEERKFDE